LNPKHQSFQHAVARLAAVLCEPGSMTQREASIHCFEFAFELGWKSIQAALKEKGLDAASPRDCFAQAWRLRWIDAEEAWLDMLRDRNLTSHTYKDDLALEVYRRLSGHSQLLAALSQKLASI
jgi:nucleotidyltransferase substrate binding protein (TIGR01987 family)